MIQDFLVKYGYRRDNGICSSKSTHFAEIVVEAWDEDDARFEAIDAAYSENIEVRSHVIPLSVTVFKGETA